MFFVNDTQGAKSFWESTWIKDGALPNQVVGILRAWWSFKGYGSPCPGFADVGIEAGEVLDESL